ncbi:MAG TPA: AMP-binding protein, partial [Isosphaeraceae bacterium]|nr:AMP-binding protein [Isosphaeraceae bacterium]
MATETSSGSITSVLQETRVFPPPAEFSQSAHIKSLEEYQELWNRAKDDPEGFWGEQAKKHLSWFRTWDKVLDWNLPFARWFTGGQINASYNCVDRHCEGPNKNKAALIFEGEPGDRRVLRYQDLLREVSKFGSILKSLGVKKGDVVGIYLPMIPELVIATLACARIGAPHTVIFGGFSAEALAGRIQDCKAKVLITADGGYRRGKVVPLKENADGAAAECPLLQHVVVYRRTGSEIAWTPGRDHWWHELEVNAS